MKYLLAVFAFLVSSLAFAQTTITFGSGPCQVGGSSYVTPSVYCYNLHGSDGGTFINGFVLKTDGSFANGYITESMDLAPVWTSSDFAGTVTGSVVYAGSGTVSGTFTAVLPDGTAIVGTLVENFTVIHTCTRSGRGQTCKNRMYITDDVIAY